MATDQKHGESGAKTAGILGSGQYASALAVRLVRAGYDVTIGSRRPDDVKLASSADAESGLADVRVTTLQDCIRSNSVIFVAIHSEHFKVTFTPEVASWCAGKILIDVTNRDAAAGSAKGAKTSNARILADLLPHCTVVKAFNTLSAYALESDSAGGSRRVPVASDDVRARAVVCDVARDMGLEAHEAGGLGYAVQMEESLLRVFPEWRMPVLLAVCVFAFWTIFALTRFYWAASPRKMKWEQLPLKILNKVFGASTQTFLALTYLPSTCAACLQLIKGRKRGALPWWLITWLGARKQIGLLAFFLVSVHVVISTLIVSPTYMPSWFRPDSVVFTVPANNTQDVVINVRGAWMTWEGELSLLIGILAVALIALLALTSLPSVTSAMSWGEWRLVHSKLGYVMMTLGVTHVCVMGMGTWIKAGFPLVLSRVSFMSIALPSQAVVLRVVLLLPCLANRLDRIRRGWESHPTALKHSEQDGRTAV